MIQTGLNDYLFDAIRAGASDLHITVGLPPMVRVNGEVQPLDYSPLTANVTRELVYDILSNDQRQRLENDWELDFSYTLPRTARFRVNVYFQKGALGAAFRTIPQEVLSLHKRGLVLVTGPTGSGKSTTLAAMIDKINETKNEHIMSVEDPIEFLHNHKKCIVNQREVNQDTKSFAQALKHVLR
jgi:twitching motility protein PilT